MWTLQWTQITWHTLIRASSSDHQHKLFVLSVGQFFKQLHLIGGQIIPHYAELLYSKCREVKNQMSQLGGVWYF